MIGRGLARRRRAVCARSGDSTVEIEHEAFGWRWLHFEGEAELLFTENETNNKRLFNGENRTPFVKDAFNEYLINGDREAVNPERTGTKAAANYKLTCSGAFRDRFADEADGQRGFTQRRKDRKGR
jgi:hypothetical protein